MPSVAKHSWATAKASSDTSGGAEPGEFNPGCWRGLTSLSEVRSLARASFSFSRSIEIRSKGSLLVPMYGWARGARSGWAPPVPTGGHSSSCDAFSAWLSATPWVIASSRSSRTRYACDTLGRPGSSSFSSCPRCFRSTQPARYSRSSERCMEERPQSISAAIFTWLRTHQPSLSR